MSAPTLRLYRRQLTLGDFRTTLSAPEARIVHALLDHPGHVFTKAALLTIGWRPHDGGRTRLLDSALVRLNHQLRPVAGATVFENVWGVGCRLAAAVAVEEDR